MIKPLAIAALVVAACADDPESCWSIVDPASCHAAPGCQLSGGSCTPPSVCADVPQPTCRATQAPTVSGGAACDTLDAIACYHRDDCDVMHVTSASGTAVRCVAQP